MLRGPVGISSAAGERLGLGDEATVLLPVFFERAMAVIGEMVGESEEQ